MTPWIMSQVLKYKRKHKHGLGGWGEHLGYSKFEFSDWSQFRRRNVNLLCERRRSLNTKVYEAAHARVQRPIKD